MKAPERSSRFFALVLLIGAGVSLSSDGQAQSRGQQQNQQNKSTQQQGARARSATGAKAPANQQRARSATGGSPNAGTAQNQQRARSATGTAGVGAAQSQQRARSATGGMPAQGAARARSATPTSAARSATGAKKARAAAPRTTGASSRIQRTASTRKRTDNGRVIPNVQGAGVDFQSAADAAIDMSSTKCIDAFVKCIDSHIEPTIGDLDWLVGGTDIITRSPIPPDEAYLSIIDTGEPFRCAFWDPLSPMLRTTSPLPSCTTTTRFGFVGGNDRCHCVGENCFDMMDMNQLYSAYNFYCQISRKYRNSIGRWGNQCSVRASDGSRSSVFASKFSIAYYREVLNRVDNGDLKMINIEDSAMFQNFMNSQNFQNVDRYTISKTSRNEIFSALNLAEETELFSINVAPPAGVGNFISSSAFGRAFEDCTSTQPLTIDDESNAAKRTERNKARAQFGAMGCPAMSDNLARYYLTGMWKNIEALQSKDAAARDAVPEQQGIQTAIQVADSGVGKEVKTSFLSARDSCHMYELALQSVRDVQFGLFDTEMQNFIEDSIVQILENKLKAMRKLGTIVDEVRDLNEQMQDNADRRQTELNKLEADQRQQDQDFEDEKLRIAQEADAMREDAVNRTKAELSTNYGSKMIQKCDSMMTKMYGNACGNIDVCFAANAVKYPFNDLLADSMKLKVKISMSANIVGSTDAAFASASTSAAASDNRYYEFECRAIDGFSASNPQGMKTFSVILGALETRFRDMNNPEKLKPVLSALKEAVAAAGFGELKTD